MTAAVLPLLQHRRRRRRHRHTPPAPPRTTRASSRRRDRPQRQGARRDERIAPRCRCPLSLPQWCVVCKTMHCGVQGRARAVLACGERPVLRREQAAAQQSAVNVVAVGAPQVRVVSRSTCTVASVSSSVSVRDAGTAGLGRAGGGGTAGDALPACDATEQAADGSGGGSRAPR
jgi:hypothetical protein